MVRMNLGRCTYDMLILFLSYTLSPKRNILKSCIYWGKFSIYKNVRDKKTCYKI